MVEEVLMMKISEYLQTEKKYMPIKPDIKCKIYLRPFKRSNNIQGTIFKKFKV